jgi:1-acyl-sn-glycerol-3-phosphate acyltransferase
MCCEVSKSTTTPLYPRVVNLTKKECSDSVQAEGNDIFATSTLLMETQFDDIRPYTDEELPQVMAQLANHPAITQLVGAFFPQMDQHAFQQELLQLKSIKAFQSTVISKIVQLIIDTTSKGLSYSGLDGLDPKKAYVFISNHRDIVLDSALINYILNKEGFETARIAIGINLLSKAWITHLVKLNKSFVVKRDLPRNEMYAASLQLSAYIRHSIVNDNESVWIAQREGRSKNGDDRTHNGLLNMLGMSKQGELHLHFQDLNIVPVALSYELDPCDGMKLPELYAKANNLPYTKGEEEDYNSMREGIQGQNGRIHVAFGTPIGRLPAVDDTFKKGDLIQQLADAIDAQIHAHYRLWPNAYVAADLLSNTTTHAGRYTAADKAAFEDRLKQVLNKQDIKEERMRELLLNIYANPVINQLNSAVFKST